jgi:hypothetical protein
MNAPEALRPDSPRIAVPMREEDLRGSASRPQLDGYRLHEPIWQSQVAVVWLATDLMLKLPVAIKEYLPVRQARRHSATLVVGMPGGGAAFDDGLHAFLEEARTLARADDPSLVRVIRLFQANGTAYRVMPHAPGPCLLDACAARTTPFEETALRALLGRLLDAVQAWHAVGGVHGRVAPDNLLLLADDRPLLLGPGAASAALKLAPALPSHDLARAPHEDDGADGDWPAGPWLDVYDVARIGRFCLTREWDGAARRPAGSLVERFGASPLLAALDAAASASTHRRAQSVAQLRRWLVNGPPGYLARATRDAPPVEARAPAADAPTAQVVPLQRPEPVQTAPSVAPAPVAADGWRASAPQASFEPARESTFESTLPPSDPAFKATLQPLTPTEASTRASPDRDPFGPATEPELAHEPTHPVERPFVIGADESTLHWAPRALERRRRGLHAWLAAIGASLALIAVGAGVWVAQQPVHIAGLTYDGAGPRPPAEARAPSALPVEHAPADETAAPTAAPTAATTAVVAPADPAAAVSVPGEASVPTSGAVGTAPAQEAPLPAPAVAAAATEEADRTARGAAPPAPPQAPEPAARRPSPVRAPAGFASPREACAGRSEFSLYRCMHAQCAKPQWNSHAQCARLRVTDDVR